MSFIEATRKSWRKRIKDATVSLVRIPRMQKSLMVFAADVTLCILATFVAFSLRVGALSFPVSEPLFFAAVAVPLFAPIFYLSGVYSTIFRFAGARTIFNLGKATFAYSLPLMIVFLFRQVPDIPRTVAVIQPILFFCLMATARVGIRYLVTDVVLADHFGGGIQRVMIFGAGAAGQQLALAMRHEPNLMLVGFIDDDKRLRGQRLNETRIFHSSELSKAIEKRRVDRVMLALPNASRKRRAQIIEQLRPYKVSVLTLPAVSEIVDGTVSVNDLKEIQIEDLLGRDTVPPNEILLGKTIVGKTVLVTGAGGSIGSELCRQIVQIGPKTLVLLEISEFALYSIEMELAALAAELGREIEIVPVLGSAADRETVDSVFRLWQPQTVYHAAAYKHVPLVEANPLEGIRNNVLGTARLLAAVEQFGAADFILISTDKAVRPTNVMGASKRAAEQLVQSRASEAREGRYSMVRFGNVLGSSGSVVPLFRQQIEAGGPVTLTHKDVNRYFMTIPEAALLVIQAGGMARGGEVFVLDMGKPVRIGDLAQTMIELSGLTVYDEHENPDGDIEITEVGLRPGEKLYEELLIGSKPEKTDHKRIMKASEAFADRASLDQFVTTIERCTSNDEAIGALMKIVPEFDHDRDVKAARAE